MANLNNEQLRRLARLGAVSRLEQIKDEEAAIRAEFPELFGGTAARSTGRGRRRRGPGRPPASESAGATTARKRSGRRAMSASQRRAVSERMKRYWAERRKAKGSGK